MSHFLELYLITYSDFVYDLFQWYLHLSPRFDLDILTSFFTSSIATGSTVLSLSWLYLVAVISTGLSLSFQFLYNVYSILSQSLFYISCRRHSMISLIAVARLCQYLPILLLRSKSLTLILNATDWHPLYISYIELVALTAGGIHYLCSRLSILRIHLHTGCRLFLFFHRRRDGCYLY